MPRDKVKICSNILIKIALPVCANSSNTISIQRRSKRTFLVRLNTDFVYPLQNYSPFDVHNIEGNLK